MSPCHEANIADSVFVQGIIFNKTTKTLMSYSPIVIDNDTQPGIKPVAIKLSANVDVAIFGGGNDDVTKLIGDGHNDCVNGSHGSPFGQVFFCGTEKLFKDVNAAHINIPPIGKDINGEPCPTVRSFKIVDQDQSDNVQTTYIINTKGQIAQNTLANRTKFITFTIIKNGSDNTLLSKFVAPSIGCKTWAIPDAADNGNLVSTQATNELQAASYQKTPIAYIPLNDPMTQTTAKTNLYRLSVDQPIASNNSTSLYCSNIKSIAPYFIEKNKGVFSASSSPAQDTNLYDFMKNRLVTTYQLLGC